MLRYNIPQNGHFNTILFTLRVISHISDAEVDSLGSSPSSSTSVILGGAPHKRRELAVSPGQAQTNCGKQVECSTANDRSQSFALLKVTYRAVVYAGGERRSSLSSDSPSSMVADYSP